MKYQFSSENSSPSMREMSAGQRESMKQIYPLITALLLLTQILPAQEIFQRQPHDYIWMLGRGDLMMDFTTSPPLYNIINSPIEFHNTNSSIANANGELKLYTNGMQVLNKNYDFVHAGYRINNDEDMDGYLWSGLRLYQGALLLPFPGDTNSFNLFYTKFVSFINENGMNDASSQYLYHAEAQFTEEYTNGTLIDEDFIVINDTLGSAKITACRHGNGRDWWLLVPNLTASQYHRILVSDQGVEDKGTITVGEGMKSGLGQAKFSPNGTKYINYSLPNFDETLMTFYDFDRCTGELSNPILHREEIPVLKAGLSISENSRFAYLSTTTDIYQYDLEANDIPDSEIHLDEYDGYYIGNNPNFNWTGFGLSQLGPDGRIYIATAVSTPHMHLIHEPNKRGLASRFEQRTIEFPVWNTRTIPNFPYYGLGPWDGSPCDTLNIDNPTPEAAFEHTQDTLGQQIEFFDASHYAYEWEWSFGDGSAVSTEQHPIHTYENAGAYDICLTISNVTGTDMYCETIYIGVNNTQEVFVPGVSISVSPNPFRERFKFQVGFEVGGLQTSAKEVQLRVYNVAGQQIFKNSLPGQGGLGWVDGSQWPKGLYFYEVWGATSASTRQLLATGKLIKQ